MRSTAKAGRAVWLRYLFLVLRALYLALALAIFCRVHLFGFDATMRWCATALAVVLVILACWRRGGMRAWLILMVGLRLFLEVRTVADDLGFPLHTDDLRQFEQLFFLGRIPSYVLQRAFFAPGRLGGLDYFSVAIHLSYFFVPYFVLFGIWLIEPNSTHRLAELLVLTFAIGLVIYILLPATPPWLASLQPGTPKIYRIVHFVGTSVDAETYERIYENIGDPNPTAALPSVHFAITFMLFLYALGRSRWWSILAAAYSLAMVWALVYLGEHYVVDCIFGGLVAWAVWYAYERLRSNPAQ